MRLRDYFEDYWDYGRITGLLLRLLSRCTNSGLPLACVCVHACALARARVCVCACIRVPVRACVCLRARVRLICGLQNAVRPR